MSWILFRCQCQAVAERNWTARENATHAFAFMQGQAGNILHSVVARAAYEDVVEALHGRYGQNGNP
jgi:hypothetical protein